MEFINLILIGTAGYILVCIYDLSQLYRKTLLRYMSSTGFILTSVPYIILLSNRDFVQLTISHVILFTFLAILTGLLIYSVLIEIPLYYHRMKGRESSPGSAPPQLYRQGTYGFSRHPGFIWYTGINSLFIILDTRYLMLMVILTICNLLLIIVEDIHIFPRLFPGYEAYKESVPFILSVGIRNKRES